MPRKKKEGATPLERSLELLDEKVKAQCAAELKAHDLANEVTKLISETRRHGAAMSELTSRVKRMDVKERKAKPVTRQAVHARISVAEGHLPARTTRASRRRREPVGTINAEALR
jgi:hypothetical protein